MLADAVAALESFTRVFARDASLVAKAELLERTDLLERASRVLQYGQVIGAHTIDVQNLARTGETDASFCWDAGEGRKSRYRSTQDYLVGRLRISRFEATRRVYLGRDLLPSTSVTGQDVEPRYPVLATVAASGIAGAEALSAAATALGRARVKATGEQLAAMETSLAAETVIKDPGAVAVAGRHLEYLIDQDGTPPGEEELKARQGVHYHGHKRGLEHLEIFATPSQLEVLATVMNTGTNPRTQTGAERAADGRTRPQRMLDALVGACQSGLAAAGLPTNGGIRPQVLATIDYQQLLSRLQHAATGTGLGVRVVRLHRAGLGGGHPSVGLRRGHHPGGPQWGGPDPEPGPGGTDLLPRPAPGPGRPRRGLHVPGLHHARRVDRGPPHGLLAERWTDRHSKRVSSLLMAPPFDPPGTLANRYQHRRALVHPTPGNRPRPKTPSQHLLQTPNPTRTHTGDVMLCQAANWLRQAFPATHWDGRPGLAAIRSSAPKTRRSALRRGDFKSGAARSGLRGTVGDPAPGQHHGYLSGREAVAEADFLRSGGASGGASGWGQRWSEYCPRRSGLRRRLAGPWR